MALSLVVKYPRILSEQETIVLVDSGRSIARFGDGELRIAINKGCTSQRPDARLAAEFRSMLAEPGDCLVGIPNALAGPKIANWGRYAGDQFVRLYKKPVYASAFISRPDSAPWIDTPEYWQSVRDLWKGREIVLVVGDEKSITERMMMDSGAKSVRVVMGPRQHAYAEIDRIESEIGKPAGRVILCLGATATALAFRLHKKGVHAIDLGHLGMFMKHAGAYRYTVDDLVSRGYLAQLSKMHADSDWGADGAKHAPAVMEFADKLDAKTVLDYGCGRGALAEAIGDRRRIMQYDPGVHGRAGLPKPVDLVVCTDVLEHVEPKRLKYVLDHIGRLAGKGVYLVIATRPANAVLPDGRNAHLIVEPGIWWSRQIIERMPGLMPERTETTDGRELRLWLTKP